MKNKDLKELFEMLEEFKITNFTDEDTGVRVVRENIDEEPEEEDDGEYVETPKPIMMGV